MKYIVFFYISISILFFSGCKPNIVLEQNTVIKNNTVWEGTIHIKGDVFVDKGVKLIIKPGSIIIFDILKQNVSIDEMIKEGPYSPQAELIINGAIEAEGTSEKPIIFTSKTDKDKVKEGQWGSINFIGSEHGSLKYCEIRGAYMGVHIHSSTISIENCKFINN
ncbi:MAG: hypothetical protein HY934_01145, partial [Candidatus Firestonebacteria bacterium]|nr:hypothetical protein [Candidatus Firestonebacteria bacterium]